MCIIIIMKVLELFSGTGSVGKCCDQLGWDKVSVDMLLPADHKCDVMDFDYKQYAKDEFDIIWASPPCTSYSQLKQCWYGNKLKDGTIYSKELHEKEQDEADLLVLKTLEIIDYFDVEYWFMENPQTGNLKNRKIMKDLPFYDIDYCMYSDWGYRKRTRIWTNKEEWDAKKCDGSGACGNMSESRKHKLNVANDVHTVGEKKKHEADVQRIGGGTNRLDRYRVPEDLIFSLFLE
tara:strand:- start:4769 stop:5470 length:702 start_codon:yes stop_codon:yes gene_type:complete